MSVANAPGRIAFTRTVGANVSASPTVKALSPALAHAYGSSFALAISEPIVPTLMIDPPPASRMCVAASVANRNGPLRFTASVLSKRSSVTAARFS